MYISIVRTSTYIVVTITAVAEGEEEEEEGRKMRRMMMIRFILMLSSCFLILRLGVCFFTKLHRTAIGKGRGIEVLKEQGAKWLHYSESSNFRVHLQKNQDVPVINSSSRENDSDVLASFEAEIFSLKDLLEVVWAWSLETVTAEDEDFRTIMCSKTFNGCEITFNAAPSSSLTIFVEEFQNEVAAVTSLRSILVNDVENIRLKSLIHFSATNLLDSCSSTPYQGTPFTQ